MTVKHWSERDYYRATRDAYRAWQRSWEQLVLGLEGADAGTTSLVASAPSSPHNGLAAGEGKANGIGRGSSSAASPPSPHADGTHSDLPPRDGEGGLDNPTTRENTSWA